jgi:hypothetical protein
VVRDRASAGIQRAVVERTDEDVRGARSCAGALMDLEATPTTRLASTDSAARSEHDDRLHDCTIRLRERLAVVRPSIARLRSLAPSPTGHLDRDLVELGIADVRRALVQARRTVRALVAELANLEREGRLTIADASRLLSLGGATS